MFATTRRNGFQLSASSYRLLVGWAGLVLMIVSWWAAWFGPAPFSEYTFFPLWLGYILAADGLTAQRVGTSLLTRSPGRFVLLFVYSMPLWWFFELANHFLSNWRYLLPSPWDALQYWAVASLSFSTVMPAIFVTAALLRTFAPFSSPRQLLRFDLGRRGLAAISLSGVAMVLLSLAMPHYLFPLVWIGLFLALDPLNERLGNPSLIAEMRRGRWDSVFVLGLAGLACGFLWELWNVYSMPKWIYDVPFVGGMKLFEMPILGYGGYPPFALEVFAAWSLLNGWFRVRHDGWPGFAGAHDTRWTAARSLRGEQAC